MEILFNNFMININKPMINIDKPTVNIALVNLTW
jgi:hypothetical protein